MESTLLCIKVRGNAEAERDREGHSRAEDHGGQGGDEGEVTEAALVEQMLSQRNISVQSGSVVVVNGDQSMQSTEGVPELAPGGGTVTATEAPLHRHERLRNRSWTC